MRSLSQNNQLAAAFSLIIFMLALSFPQEKDQKSKGQDPNDQLSLSAIREWALQQNLWPDVDEDLVAIRQVYYTEEQSLKFSAFLLVPCSEICPHDSKSCARLCQNHLIQRWDADGISSKARLMFEAFDTKEQVSLGRLILQDIAPIKLRYFSRKHGLIALIQTKSEQDRILHLIKLGNENENKSLKYYDMLQLGLFHGEEAPLEGSVTFKTANSGQLEMLAPLESLTKLRPAFYLPVPYILKPHGIRLAPPENIELQTPKANELRNFLLSLRGTDAQAMHPDKIKASLSFVLLLCFTKKCETGEDLLKFAYPQNELVLNWWKQLRAYVDQVGETQNQSVKPSPSQYSILDQ